MERLIGVAAAGVVGKPWDKVGTRTERKWLLQGKGLRTGELAVRGEAGLIQIAVTVWQVHSRADSVQGVMCWVERVVYDGGSHPESRRCYEIATSETPGEFGQIMRVHDGAQEHVGRRCFEVIAGQSAPCDKCPVRVPMLAIGARQTAVMTDPDASLVVVRATRLSSRSARVCRDRIDAELMTSLARARLDAIAGDRKLSEREREVLHLLAWGASVDEIAHTLDITPRTVKFHAANVLTKLGLDSRLELVRLVLDGGASPALASSQSRGLTGRAASKRTSRPASRARKIQRRQMP